MFDLKRTRLGGLIVAVIVAGACESSTGPTLLDDFDAEAALADYQAVDAILASNGWAGFEALGARAPFVALGASSTGAMVMLGSAARLASKGDPETFAVELARAAASMDVPAAAPIISEGNRGKTFIYDPSVMDYVADPSRTEAPSNGVRFILYEESNGQPDPEREIGHADLIDEGSGSIEDIALRLIVVREGLEILDYRTSLDGIGDNQVRITVGGFLQNNVDRLDFEIQVEGTEGEDLNSIDVRFSMGIDSRDFSIEGAVLGTEGAEQTGSIDISVRHGDESLRVDLARSEGTLEGTILLNGEVFATASGDADSPTFTSSDGDALTTFEVGVLIQVVGVVVEVMGLFEGLVGPVAGLVMLGIVL